MLSPSSQYCDDQLTEYLGEMDLFPNLLDSLGNVEEMKMSGLRFWNDEDNAFSDKTAKVLLLDDYVLYSEFSSDGGASHETASFTASPSSSDDGAISCISGNEPKLSLNDVFGHQDRLDSAEACSDVGTGQLKFASSTISQFSNDDRVIPLPSSGRRKLSNDVTCLSKKTSPPFNDDQVIIRPSEKKRKLTNDAGLSKNAIAARENRIKKKQRTNELEKSVQHLGAKNRQLEELTRELRERSEALASEASYLRSVLANVDPIAKLVRAVRNVTPLDCSLVNGAVYPPVTPKVGRKPVSPLPALPSAGVCLHVNNKLMSLEFCPRCNRSGTST